jgi:tetratricopeptide (TPR) repeat protein
MRVRGPFSAGAELADAVCALAGLDAARLRGRTAVHGFALDSLGPAEARRHYEAALQLARECGDQACQAACCPAWDAHRSQKAGWTKRGRSSKKRWLARQIGDAVAECTALNGLAGIDFAEGRLRSAWSSYEAALLRERATPGTSAGSVHCWANLGTLYANIGRLGEGGRCFEQSLALARQLGDRQS